MTHLDLFSGIGGFALAAQWAGFTTIGFSEIEPYACKILSKHWPGVPNYGDIRNVRGITADLATGGFPCQPFSVAGKRRGAEDDRHLWPEMRRVIEDARPSWVVGENVTGIIGMELDKVLSDLDRIGYSCWPLVIPACAVGAWHRRDRVWIIANAERGQQPWGESCVWEAGRVGRIIEPFPWNRDWQGPCASFEEWMMGYDTGWTELTAFATPSSRRSRSKSCAPSQQ